MGLESYFLKILPKGVYPSKKNNINFFEGISKSTFIIFKEKLNSYFNFEEIDFNTVIINNALKIDIGNEGEYLKEITIEGCFCYYKEGLRQCYAVLKVIEEIIGEIEIYHPRGFKFLLKSEEEFIKEIELIYKKKYDEFNNTFGYVQFKSLPDDEFYKKLEKEKRKKLFKKIFTFFK